MKIYDTNKVTNVSSQLSWLGLSLWNEREARFEFGETMNGLGGIGGHDIAVYLYRTGNKPGLMDWYLEWEVIGNLYEQPDKK